MANERKTEQLVRKHFEKFADKIIIEEQKSDNAKIDKLLKTASKKGTGQGYPEFIISFKENSDLLIVVECKAEVTKHESKNKVKYSEYAVDGALLYASYLSKSFDVIALAVSGETKQSLKISHFLHLKSEKKATSKFDDKFLSAEDYLKGYENSEEKFRQDYNALLEFTKELNSKLHTHKILGSQRSLLISSILIALENKAFRKSYGVYDNAENLSNFLTQTVSNELESANITGKKLNNLDVQFSFIKTDTSLSKKENVLKEIIDEIDDNINSFMKTHRYFDVLGQLYIEFLRYANSDKGLGIVLTPPHITEFFSDLAGVNKNTIAYDNCTGTGGFLISAMSKMIKDAKDDQEKIKKIKSKQLIGTEYQSHIFALAVSNMYIHQDGKTNIINGSCFEPNIIKEVKAKKPTVGFLNPPYKANKKIDTDEFEFILNNLECLVDGGTCIAIVPMQSALATKGKVYEFKKKLLEKHTLEAVLSMPDELFFNSKVGVVSCIMVFTAHRQHPKHKETYFGYYKDDGYVKRKTKGRIDAYGRWEKLKEKWLSNYVNKKREAGVSISKPINAEMEWVAEAYMETKYTELNSEYFSETLLFYATFLLGNKLSNEVSHKPFHDKNIQFNTQDWEYFELEKLFTITGSKTTPLLELEEYGTGVFSYVTTQATNNGVEGFYDFSTEKGNVLTVDSAVLGYCSYQELDFSASDHVEKLIPKFEMNEYVAVFLVTIMNLERYRYNYGRKCSQTRMKEISIKLPSKDNEPDFKFMEHYIKTLPYSSSIKMKEIE
ncbi:MAG: N-6 DNA methylase [Flavobacteriaceae bacterium]|nr:MAG: N-6 DNA methylase [Flavobacteriaceae bacterium]QMU64246.1 MAG: N-6 DNA methylase [Flavobacteriaceae bacterium]